MFICSTLYSMYVYMFYFIFNVCVHVLLYIQCKLTCSTLYSVYLYMFYFIFSVSWYVLLYIQCMCTCSTLYSVYLYVLLYIQCMCTCSTLYLECKQGYWSSPCEKCGHCEMGNECNVTTGHCEKCQDGYELPLCVDGM